MSVRQIVEVGIVGAGTMGSAIAQHFLMEGVKKVHLVDLNPKMLVRSEELIRASLQDAVQRGLVHSNNFDHLINNITFSDKTDCLVNCDLVVEAITEIEELKKKLFLEIETIIPPSTILVSNTSSLSVNELMKGLKFPERFFGVHYFYHAAKNKFLEIIPSELSSQETLQTLYSFYLHRNKIPIFVKDSPGFAVNRFFVPCLNEATRLLEEGVGTIACIDKISCAIFGISMGPFALMNATGVSVAAHAASSLGKHFGPFYSPSLILRRKASEGELWELDGEAAGDEEKIKRRMLASVFWPVIELTSEGVVSPEDVDLGAILGLKWLVGPCEMINNFGKTFVKGIVSDLFFNRNLSCPPILNGSPYEPVYKLSYVSSRIEGCCGIIEVNQPHTLNALNENVVQQLLEHFIRLENDLSLDRVIFQGRGKAFIAGADIKYFLRHMDSRDFEQIRRFAETTQDLFKKIANSSKTTVAYLNGLTLGGGLELALSCDYRISTNKTKLGFPETGIGIYPALGGTQRTPRLIGKGLAKFLISTGKLLNAEEAKQMGLIDFLSDSPLEEAALASFSFDLKNAREKMESPLEEKFKTFRGDIELEVFDADEELRKYTVFLKDKAPLALRKAMELVDQGSEMELDHALRLELESIPWIFSTKDAKEGLNSVISRKKPVYEGT